MKAFVVLAVLGAAFGAPTENKEVQLWKDTKAPVFLAPGDNERKLRAVEEKQDDHMRSYYDVPHGPALVAPAAIVSAAGAAVAPAGIAPAGPGALGVFPGAKVGGCAIPLLLSCAPNVHSGHLAQTSYAAPAYRADAEHKMRASEQWARSEASQMLSLAEMQQPEFQNNDPQQMQWMETERAMETEMNPHHHHHHLVALDIHPNDHHHQF